MHGELDADHRVPRRRETAVRGGGWSFTETVDGRSGSVRAHGLLSLQAADMLSGTVEALRRSGHARVVLHLGDVQTADDGGLQAIRALQERVKAGGGRLTVLGAPRPRA